MKPCVLHPQARADLLSASEYYSRESLELVARYMEEMERLVAEVGENPGVFRTFRKQSRRHFGNRFPYAVVYVERAEQIQIIAFAHFKRRPGY